MPYPSQIRKYEVLHLLPREKGQPHDKWQTLYYSDEREAALSKAHGLARAKIGEEYRVVNVVNRARYTHGEPTAELDDRNAAE